MAGVMDVWHKGVHAAGGACVVGGRARRRRPLKCAVRILLECILVQMFFVTENLIHSSKQYTVHLNMTKNNKYHLSEIL